MTAASSNGSWGEFGTPTSSCVLEMNRQLAEHGATRLELVTPYTGEVAARIAAQYEAGGFTIAAASRCDGGIVSREFANIAADVIETMIGDVAAAGADAVVVMCTNMRGAIVAERMSEELGIPVIDSAVATYQAGERLL